MDQTDAQVGQEDAPEAQINAITPEEHPAASAGSMETLLQEEGLTPIFQSRVRYEPVSSPALEKMKSW